MEKIGKKAAEKKEKIKAIKPVAEIKPLPITTKNPFGVLQFVLMTEKAIQLIETQNKMVFIVSRKSSKNAIREAAESIFNEKVKNVDTLIDQKGRKKAFIKFQKEGIAGELAIRLGII